MTNETQITRFFSTTDQLCCSSEKLISRMQKTEDKSPIQLLLRSIQTLQWGSRSIMASVNFRGQKCCLQALPSSVNSPQQNYKLYAQVNYEEGVILLSHTVLNPGAVMVITPYTVLAHLAVFGSHWLLQNKNKQGKEAKC